MLGLTLGEAGVLSFRRVDAVAVMSLSFGSKGLDGPAADGQEHERQREAGEEQAPLHRTSPRLCPAEVEFVDAHEPGLSG